MTGLQVFNNPEFGQVRTIEEEGKVLFCGSDVAKVLGYTNANKAINDHCRAITKRATTISGKEQEINFISEGDVYRLIVKSQLPSAEKFERWVFDEVLPSIRKHGLYAIDDLLENPDLLIEAATKLKEEKTKRKLAEAEREKLKIELDYSKEWLSIKRVAAMNGINWKSIDWRRLKNASARVGYGVKKIFDANYGEVNTYHMSAWEIAYPNLEI